MREAASVALAGPPRFPLRSTRQHSARVRGPVRHRHPAVSPVDWRHACARAFRAALAPGDSEGRIASSDDDPIVRLAPAPDRVAASSRHLFFLNHGAPNVTPPLPLWAALRF